MRHRKGHRPVAGLLLEVFVVTLFVALWLARPHRAGPPVGQSVPALNIRAADAAAKGMDSSQSSASRAAQRRYVDRQLRRHGQVLWHMLADHLRDVVNVDAEPEHVNFPRAAASSPPSRQPDH